MLMRRIRPFLSALCLSLLCSIMPQAGEPLLDDEVNPQLTTDYLGVVVEPPHRENGIIPLWEDSSLTIRSTYYGRSRYADNRDRQGSPNDQNEIHVNAFGQGLDFRSGYAWGVIGFDITGQTNLGHGNGNSEVLYYDGIANKDKSSVSLGQAALKTRLGDDDFAFEARGGFTPISVGSLGTSGGLHSHAYRGFETKFKMRDFWIGYGWADQFRNEWDDTFREITSHWDQNRWYNHGGRISYVHSLGARYEFGPDKAGFVDLGVGEGRRYRRNLQGAVSVPVELCNIGRLTLTGYGIAAKYRNGGLFANGKTGNETEYHVSGSAQLETGDWTFMTGLGHTSSPDSGEMQFRLSAWGNSDNRNFIQTWGQLDDFVWDGQNVVKTGAKYAIGKRVSLPGLSVGASYLYGWNADNPGRNDKSNGWEVDYNIEYAVQEGRLKGLSMGVYAAHLRYAHNRFSGKQNRNDIKVILSYSKTLESFLRRR